MSLGYQLPGTIITETTKALSFNTTSSRRRPCAIGVASPYKRVSNELVTRQSSGDDALAFSSLGITKIISVGSQKGLKNFKENTHFQVIDNKIAWFPKIYNKESVLVSDILSPINYNTTLPSGVSGEAEKSGYCYISTSPNTIVAALPHELPTGNYTLRVVVDYGAIETITIAVISDGTWEDIIAALDTALAGKASVTLDAGKIKFQSYITGVKSAISVSDGVIGGLLAAINSIGTYIPSIESSVFGEASTSGYSTLSIPNVYIVESMMTQIPAGTYNVGIAVDGGPSSNKSIIIPSDSVWGDVCSALDSISGIKCTIVNGVITISSDATGTTSDVALTAGASEDLITAIATVYPEAAYGSHFAGVNATTGYTDIATAPTILVNGVRSRIATGTYKIKINANGNGLIEYSVDLSETMTWGAVIDALNASDIKDVAIASISSGKLRFTSKISGSSSYVVVVDGDTNGLLAAIKAVSGVYISNINSPVAGTAATPGYAEIESTPEGFVTTKQCNLPSGIYTLRLAVDGDTAVSIDIPVTGATQTWASIIENLSSSIVVASVGISASKIRFTSKSIGTASSVVITDGATNGLLNALNTLTASTLDLKVGALKYDRDLIETRIQLISGVTTYDLTLVRAEEEGSTVLKISGDPVALEQISANTVLYIENRSTWLTPNASYFVSYEYNRPESEYNKVKIFNSFQSLKEDLGDDIPTNKLVMWAKLALQLYGNIDVAVVQVKAETKSSYINALEAIKYTNVKDIFALNSDEDIRSYVRSHVIERSLPENKRYRMAYFGAPIGTPIGDEDNSNSVRGMSVSLKHERCVFMNAVRALYYYDDPETGAEYSTLVDGAFIAAAVGAYRCIFVDPTTPLIGKTIPGLELLDEDYDAYYSEYQLKNAGSSSCFLLAPSAGGGMLVIDDLTTDNSTVERNNINIITVKDYIAEDMANGIDRTFKGTPVYNSDDYEKNLNKYIAGKMNEYKRNRIIAAVESTSAKRHESKRDTYLFKYAYEAVYTHKYTEGSFELV